MYLDAAMLLLWGFFKRFFRRFLPVVSEVTGTQILPLLLILRLPLKSKNHTRLRETACIPLPAIFSSHKIIFVALSGND